MRASQKIGCGFFFVLVCVKKMLYPPFVFRMVLTIPVLLLARYAGISLGYLIVLLIVLDQLDCIRLSPEDKNLCQTYDYVRYDKVADISTYFLTLLLFYHLFPPYVMWVLWFLWLWRLIGVVKLFYKDDRTLLYTYIDGLNGVMIATWLAGVFPHVRQYLPFYLCVAIFVKAVFERFHHRRPFYPADPVSSHVSWLDTTKNETPTG